LPIRVRIKLLSIKKGIASGSLPRLDLIWVKTLFTLLSFFRACSPNYGEVKISTITGPFTGRGETLPGKELRAVLETMKRESSITFNRKPSVFMFSSKAGPNSSIAVLGLGVDLLG
jgi:hypothetical protein